MKKSIAAFLSSILFMTAPGLAGYAAAASIIVPSEAAGALKVQGVPVGGAFNGTAPFQMTPGAVTPATLQTTLSAVIKAGVQVQPGVTAAAEAAGLDALLPALAAPAVLPGAAFVSDIPQARSPAGLSGLLGQKESLSLPADKLAAMPAGQARASAFSIMDRILGVQAAQTSQDTGDILPPAGTLSSPVQGLAAATPQAGSVIPPAPPAAPAMKTPGRAPRGPVSSFLLASLRVAGAAGLVVGLQAAGAALLPAVFGLVPVAAVWAVSSGILLLPIALYARHRLALRDSPRLGKVKWLLDGAIGAYLGAAFIAAPSLAMTLTAAHAAAAALPVVGLLSGNRLSRSGSNDFLDSMMVWAGLTAIPLALGAGAAGLISLGAMGGMIALPVMTTVAFFLGRLIHAAETGAPFSVPGTMKKLRFPSFNWVMIGVVFTLITGYSAVYTNIAFLAWNFLGNRQWGWQKDKALWKNVLGNLFNFNTLYLGLLAFTAATAFASPLSFLVLAFAPERAAVWTEKLLGKLLPKAEPAPSTKAAPLEGPAVRAEEAPKWPQFHYRLKTVLMLGSMAAMGFAMGATVFGYMSLLKNTAIAAALAGVPFFFATWIIKKVMKTQPATENQDPEFFAIMKELRGLINADRAQKGKKPIPMPEMVNDPMEAPNAYATGRSPFKALVGATEGIKEMTLEPEVVRSGVVRLLAASDPGGKAYKAFRKAIAGSVPGVHKDAAPRETAQAVLRADQAQLKALGVRMLRGVMAHEFSHVMDRHMLIGSIAGAISSGVAFASYGVMWAVGHAQVALTRIKDRILGRRQGPKENRIEALDPISAGVVLKSLPALLRIFAALWGPIVLQITQMAASRSNEGQADEDGAKLSGDPEALALALGLLTTWRPRQDYFLPAARLPIVAANAHLFTVNPLEQLHQAGALPKLDAVSEWVVGKGDDFLFNLFLTHPDTKQRMERLFDMSEALDAERGQKPPLSAPPGGGGNLSPPLAVLTLPQNAVPAGPSRGGLFRGAWRKAVGLFRVLPDEDRNREFWKYTFGQAFLTLGVNFHYTALPKLVVPSPEQASHMGYNRAGNWTAQAASSLLTGPYVDRSSVNKVIVWTSLGRAVLMLAVPLLFFHGYIFFGSFFAIIFLAGFLQSTGMTASSVAFNRILGPDESSYNRANAVSNLVMNVVGVVGPLLAGSFIGLMDAKYGFLAGNALSYGVYGSILAAVAVGYGFFLKIPRDDLLQARTDLAAKLKGDRRVKGVTAARLEGVPTLLVEVLGDPAQMDAPADFAGYVVKVVPQRRIVKELLEGLRLIWSDRFLKIYLLFSTLSVMTGDSLIFTVLPRYIDTVLGSASTALPWLHGVPLIGAFLAGLTSKAGAFGLYLAVSSLGMGVSALAMTLLRDRSQARLEGVAANFRVKLAQATPDLSQDRLNSGGMAVRATPAAVLARYQKSWTAMPDFAPTARSFNNDVLADLSVTLNAQLFDGARTPAEMEDLLERTGLSSSLTAWSQKHHAKLFKEAKRVALGGLDALERQGRWSSWLHGLGWFAYWGVFFATSLWGSVAAMGIALLLQGPAMIVWASLTQKAIGQRHPESMGKIYSSIFFYQLAFSIIGVLAFGFMMSAVPTAIAFWIAAGVMTVNGLLDLIEPHVIFKKKK